jgi:hypothetical protein
MAKAYVICAINKNDPKDILCLVQDGEYDYSYSKDRCRVYTQLQLPNGLVPLSYTVQKVFNDYRKSKTLFHKANLNRFKKKYNTIDSRDYHTYADNPNLYCWRSLKNLLATNPPPDGYIGVVRRANSKNCEIKIDLKEREELRKNKHKFDNNNYLERAKFWNLFRNLKFEVV